MSETVIKTVQGEAEYVTTQEFGSVEDAYKDHAPLTDLEAQVLETKIINTKYKLKNEDLHKANTEAFGKTNEPNR